jgi:DNA-directed RNA polymerase specialized sigma24 family protein
MAMVVQLRNEGLTYAEIGKRMGITRDVAAGMHRRSKVHA